MKTDDSPLFSKGSDDWETPKDVFAPLHRKYKFTLDGAANAHNHKLPRYLGLDKGALGEALTSSWEGERVWLNPPYSQCGPFLAKATEEACLNGVTTLALIPARTDTRYWHEFVWDVEGARPRPWVRSINFLKGRVKFVSAEKVREGHSNSAPFPSVIIEFGPAPEEK